ncbi:hypothetical protein Vadar_019482 [Vaccinium darrowii]|uniref:Uncharacterized protein n=1 Tax=Vaccinium darrowii TaxID=229202 RepID=A0ACB7YWP1_9ERIC|nr:hypothetical protein Vadar_019482 [Vaccinium darrowii]
MLCRCCSDCGLVIMAFNVEDQSEDSLKCFPALPRLQYAASGLSRLQYAASGATSHKLGKNYTMLFASVRRHVFELFIFDEEGSWAKHELINNGLDSQVHGSVAANMNVDESPFVTSYLPTSFQAFSSEHQFCRILRRADLKEMELPNMFKAIANVSDLQQVTLITKARTWKVRCVHGFLKGKGWSTFVAAHRLMSGNVLVFSFEMSFGWHVLIFRVEAPIPSASDVFSITKCSDQIGISVKPLVFRGSEPAPPRITTNVKHSLQVLKLWKVSSQVSIEICNDCTEILSYVTNGTPKPATRYRRKKVEKEDLPEDDSELYLDPTLALYNTDEGIETGLPVMLVDGYNVCGYWAKLKKHFMKGKLEIARDKLIHEQVTFSAFTGVRVSYKCVRFWVCNGFSELETHMSPRESEKEAYLYEVWNLKSQNISRAEEIKILANEAFKAYKFSQAIVLYTQAIELNSQNPVYWANRAFAHTELEEYVLRSLHDSYYQLQGYCRRGAAYLAMGKFKKALKDFQQISVQFKMQGPDLEKFRCTGIFFSQVEAALEVDYVGRLYLEKVGVLLARVLCIHLANDHPFPFQSSICNFLHFFLASQFWHCGNKYFTLVKKICPNDPDAAKKLRECEKAVLKLKFEESIYIPESERRSVANSFFDSLGLKFMFHSLE